MSKSDLDIYFLEEVDHPEEIASLLPKDEYTFHYLKKKGWHLDGAMLLYRQSKFEEIEVIKSPYKSEGCFKQNYIIAVLEEKATKQRLIASVTHLKSKKANRAVRVLEAKELTFALGEVAKKYESAPMILGLDMNDEPHSPPM